jgi:hypothetical protein
MANASRPRYSGILIKPMTKHAAVAEGECECEIAHALLGLTTVSTPAEAEARNIRQRAHRVSALYRHYGIPEHSDSGVHRLLLAVAGAHIPGFSFLEGHERGRGAPGKWKGAGGGGDRSRNLFADVRSLTTRGMSAKSACKVIAKKSCYRERYGNETGANLLRRYQEAAKDPNLVPRLSGPPITLEDCDEAALIEGYALRADNLAP